MKNSIIEQLDNLTLDEKKTVLNAFASNEDYDYYIFENLEEVLEFHYEHKEFTSEDLMNFLRDFNNVNCYSNDYMWIDAYGLWNQGSLSEAFGEKWDDDMIAQFCEDCPDEVSDYIEIPDEEEDEEDE